MKRLMTVFETSYEPALLYFYQKVLVLIMIPVAKLRNGIDGCCWFNVYYEMQGSWLVI